MKIRIEDIKKELEEKGWSVISDSYVNLNELMEFKCPQGHKVFAPYKKMREHPECPTCKANPLYEQSNSVIPKSKGIKRIIGLDQATNLTGYSIFDSNKLVRCGIFKASSEDEIERDLSIKQWLVSLIAQLNPDCIGIEGVQFQEDEDRKIGVTTFETLARLQGILMATCKELGINYKICPTNTWRQHCGVKGKRRTEKKNSMRRLVKEWYDIDVTEDEADAIGIGKYTSETYNKNFEMFDWS